MGHNGNGTAVSDQQQIIIDIPWADIRPMEGQPREYFNKEALAELATSIATVGQRVPAQVAPVSSKKHRYELIDGQRRWHAVQLANRRTLRCEVVNELDEEKRYMMSVVCNMARQGHHPMEIAVAVDRLRRIKDPETGKTLSLAQVADMMGKSVSYVDQHLQLLRLTPQIQDMIHPSLPKDKRLPYSAAVLLSKLDPGEQLVALEKIKAKGYSLLRATRQVLGEMPNTVKNKHPKTWNKYQSLQRALKRAAEYLDIVSPESFATLVATRSGDDTARMRRSLESLELSVTMMLRALPGLG